jgi:hypothetical protein
MDNNKPINDLYENLTYFDNYGSSVIFVVVFTLILIFLVCFSYVSLQAKVIRNNWQTERCKPYVLPFAGYIMKPTNMSSSDFTKENFDYCTQNKLKDTASKSLAPFFTIFTASASLLQNYIQSSNSLRAVLDKTRNLFSNILRQVFGKTINIGLYTQQLLISIKDTFGKIQGSVVAILYSFFASYLGLQSLMGIIVKFLINALIALASAIVMLWMIPATWGQAAAGTALFVAISVPLGLFVNFLQKTFQLDINAPKLKVPKPKKLKCFDENTLLEMNDGSFKEIKFVKPGELLKNNNKITAVFQVETKGSILYSLNDVIVSNTHLVFLKETKKWIRVSDHPMAKKVGFYGKPYLYCLNTQEKIIEIKETIFSDWDEVFGKSLEMMKKKFKLLYPLEKEENYHDYLENGFHENTIITLEGGEKRKIKEIKIGDILENGNKVYGVCEIDGTKVKQYEYKIKNKTIKASNNILLSDENFQVFSTIDLDKNLKTKIHSEEKLYNILTESHSFEINGLQFCDYNFSIDFFINYK